MSEQSKKSLSCFPAPILHLPGLALVASALFFPILGLLGLTSIASVKALTIIFCFALLALIIRDYFLTKKTVEALDITWELAEFSTCNSPLELKIKLVLKNNPRRLKVSLRPEALRQTQAESEIYSFYLAKGNVEHLLLHQLRTLTRGVFSWGKLYLRVSGGSFLWSWQYQIEPKEHAITNVFPNANLHSIRSVKAFQKLQAGNNIAEQRKSEGREFDSLRKYTVGDDLRKVDWKRSARGRGLFVKNYRPESHQCVSISIDCSRRMSNLIAGRTQIEYALDAAAHLIQLARTQEDEIGFFAFNHKVISSIKCRKGKKQEQLIANAMQSIRASTLEPDYQLLTEWGHSQRKRSLLILITSISNPVSLEGIRNALKPLSAKHLVLVLAIADRDLQELTQTRANSLEDAYIISAAMEQLEQIKKRQKQLQAIGIDCIYCDAALVSEMLHQKYYELKAKGKL